MTKTTAETFNILLEKIAKEHFPSVETLETRKSDGLDFHDVSVWGIKNALSDAFKLGLETGLKLNQTSK
jgi:hypothetical protein